MLRPRSLRYPLFAGSTVDVLRSCNLLVRPECPLGTGATAQILAPPTVGLIGGTPLGRRPPATVLTSSGVLDAAHPGDVGSQQECCEFVQ